MWPGLTIALLTLIIDQATKWWLLALLAQHRNFIEVTPFFNLVMVWNKGVSFGLFGSSDATGQRWFLIALAAAMVLVLLVWLYRTRGSWIAVALGLVIGGAVGNAFDRMVRGAVADFFDFHMFGWHWPAFNIADSAIVVGVAILLVDGLFGNTDRHKI